MRLPRPPCLKQLLSSRLPRVAPQTHIPRRIVTTSTTSRAPIDVPKLIVAPGSPNHNSLSSFLEYADRKKLDIKSTVYVGTHYEYTASESLRRIGFSLFRTGGKYDRGIDLIGHWALPMLREPMPVVVQCKSLCSAGNPSHIRELEGALQGVPPGWVNKDVLGVLIMTQNATAGMLDRLGASQSPLGYIKVSRAGTIETCWFNAAAQARGLEGVGVTVRYTPLVTMNKEEIEQDEDLPKYVNGKRKRKKRVPEKFIVAGTKKDIQLTWLGTPIFPEIETLDPETIRLMDVISHDTRELQRKRKDTTGLGRPPGAKNKPKSATSIAKKTTKIPKTTTTVVKK
jgi:hypothetical protein